MNGKSLDDETGTPLDVEISPMMQEVLNENKICKDDCGCKNRKANDSITIIEPEIIEAVQTKSVETEEHDCNCGCSHDYPVAEDIKNKLNVSNQLQNKKDKFRLKRKMQKESRKKNRKR